MEDAKNEANEAVRKGRSVGLLGRGFVGRREKRRREEEREENIWPIRNGKGGCLAERGPLRLEAMWPASRISGEASACALAIGQ